LSGRIKTGSYYAIVAILPAIYISGIAAIVTPIVAGGAGKTKRNIFNYKKEWRKLKIEIKCHTDSNDFEREALIIDGKKRRYVGPLCDCPEDAIIGRSLVSCSEITGYMKQAYEAGKNGDEFDVEIIKIDSVKEM